MNIVKINNIQIGDKKPFVLIAGPCVIESRKTVLHIASALKEIAQKLRIPLIFKASYDKANRTSVASFRGLGLQKGLDILKEVKDRFRLPVISDVHSVEEIDRVKQVLDVIQIPAFLCRQTDLLVAAGETRKVVNIKKGQFLAPWDLKHAIKKVEHTGNRRILLTERGTSFGYNTLVTDFRSIAMMKEFGYPVVMDATHSVQQPGGLGNSTGGCAEFIPLMAQCGLVAGANALFMEVHSNPKKALSDGPNMWPLSKLSKLLQQLKRLEKTLK